jgi:hypothetical protein
VNGCLFFAASLLVRFFASLKTGHEGSKEMNIKNKSFKKLHLTKMFFDGICPLKASLFF